MIRYQQLLCVFLLSVGILSPAFALGPHEILILVNGREPDSIEIAKHYARLRQVPECNIVRLQMPKKTAGEPPVMTPQDFTSFIWAPAAQVAKERGIADHIRAWVYSTHFPIRTRSQPPISLQGLTFVRNQMPTAKAIAEGSYHSPLFAGPDKPRGIGYAPQSFGSAARLLQDAMPLPSMALGYTGPRGNTKAEVIACLEAGTRSDATQPDGSIYFVTNSNIRSLCREWQFPDAARHLRSRGVNAVVVGSFPSNQDDIMGIMTGCETVTPAAMGRFLPGCMAEHLTSAAAMFDYGHQTKISRWIAAGATASAGTVFEPMSIWMKFPNARFYNHYATGCTMIESFYQSIRCPLQIMLVGDPLAAPWAPRATLHINGLAANDLVEAPREITLSVKSESSSRFLRFIYLIDGRIVGKGRAFTLKPETLKAGEHTFRAVGFEAGLVRSQIFEVLSFRTNMQGSL